MLAGDLAVVVGRVVHDHLDVIRDAVGLVTLVTAADGVHREVRGDGDGAAQLDVAEVEHAVLAGLAVLVVGPVLQGVAFVGLRRAAGALHRDGRGIGAVRILFRREGLELLPGDLAVVVGLVV